MSRWKIILIAVIAVALIAIGLAIYGHQKPTEKSYGSVAGHTIYQPELTAFKGKDSTIPDKDAATVLLDKYFYEKLAKENGVTVSQADITNRLQRDSSSQRTNYQRQTFTNQLYMQKVQEKVSEHYKGSFVVAYFNQDIPIRDDQGKSLHEGRDPGVGDPATIAADRSYATGFINKIYADLQAKKITFDQAITQENNDPRIGNAAIPTEPHSGKLNAIPSNQPLPAEQLAELKSMKPGATSKPFILKQNSKVSGPNDTDAYWMIIKLDESNQTGVVDFDKYINDQKHSLGYKHA